MDSDAEFEACALELCPVDACDPDPPELWLPELPEELDPPDEPP
jgi:hypothetical protein